MPDSAGAPEPENVYHKGYFPRVREKLARTADGVRLLATNPARVPSAAAGWLGEQLEKDALFFQAGLFGGWAAIKAGARAGGRGLRHPVHRRWILGLIALLAFLPGFTWQRCGFRGCPDVGKLAALQPGGAARVFDVRGQLLAELAPTRWAVVALDDLPPYVAQAFVAVEDQNFYEHRGVHWPRFIAQTVKNLVPGGRSQGASTISMQVARNVFPDRLPAADRSVKRKVLEIRVAREIEQRYTKAQILQTYLNNIYFGEGVYGIESAARIYFGKHASQLKMSEAALLAGLPKAPTHYSPRRNMARSVQRRNLVLSLMAAQGRITAGQARASKDAEVRLARLRPEARPRTRFPYFVEHARRMLEAELGPALYAGGLRIHTTLDPRVQRAAEQNVEAQLRAIENGRFGRFTGPRRAAYRDSTETPYLQGAAMVMSARTGDVLALVGGRSYDESAFDRMTQGLRQPGSAFKPFVYAAAVAEGVTPTDRVVDDTVRRELPGGEVWTPRNFDGRYRGAVTVRTSLRQSINTIAVKLAEQAGLDDVEQVARRAGITRDIPPLPSVAIGATAVRPMELVRAYTPFATLGYRVEPRFVTRVEDRDGKVVWRARVKRRRVMDRGVAFVVTTMLRGAIDRGTGTAARAALGDGVPAAGKTGTTNDATDAWFVGFTPDLVGAVWFGFDRPRTIIRQGSGGTLAAPVWGRIMRVAQRGAPEPWKAPGGVVRRTVAVSGDRVIAPGCRARGATYDEFFLRRHVPAGICPRGRRREDAGWWERVGESVRTSAGEWAREAWDDVRARARRAVGAEDEVDRDAGTRPPRREDAPRAEPVVEAPVTHVPETLPAPEEEPRDTIRIEDAPPSAPRDTLFIPDAAAEEEPAAPAAVPPRDSTGGAAPPPPRGVAR
jgi:penicillin-binding protein 1A